MTPSVNFKKILPICTKGLKYYESPPIPDSKYRQVVTSKSIFEATEPTLHNLKCVYTHIKRLLFKILQTEIAWPGLFTLSLTTKTLIKYNLKLTAISRYKY